jgi:hypothetical protein
LWRPAPQLTHLHYATKKTLRDVEPARPAPTSSRRTRSRVHTGGTIVKYILMMNTEKGPYRHDAWPENRWKAHLAYWGTLNAQLEASGELVSVVALTAPDQAKRVYAGKDGQPITDGVFPETKEFLAGYWIVDVESAERAHAIAAQASLAPGPDGKPLNMPLEVREVMMSKTQDS